MIAWLGFAGATIDGCTWRRLVSAAGGFMAPAHDRFDAEGDGWKVHAAKVRRGEPDPLHRSDDGCISLADAHQHPQFQDWEVPSDLPSALVRLDPQRQSVRLLRDRLGHQPLVWTRLQSGVLIASREFVLLALPGLDKRFDDEYLAAHLALVDPPRGRTLYRSIHCVDPGQRVDIDLSGTRRTELSFDPDTAAFAMPDDEAASEFGHLLATSVSRNVVGAGRIGLTLSGGLDSSSIAALLPPGIRSTALAVTYGTGFGGSIDERALATELCETLGMACTTFDSSEPAPTLDPTRQGIDPGYPFVNPYHPLKTRLYEALAANQVDVVLTGHYADHWNPGPVRWLAHALKNRRWDVVFWVYRDVIRSRGWRGLWREPGWRHLTRRLMRWPVSPLDADWMQPLWRSYAREAFAADIARFAQWPSPERASYVLGTYSAIDAACEGVHSDRYGFQMRHPYRDWRLIRFALSLPAYQHVRGSVDKWIARRAVSRVLPARWAERPKQGSLLPLFHEHIHGRESAAFASAVIDSESIWGSLVDPDQVRARLAAGQPTRRQDFLLFRLACLGAWIRGLEVGAHDAPDR